jgi:hypothetical protein
VQTSEVPSSNHKIKGTPPSELDRPVAANKNIQDFGINDHACHLSKGQVSLPKFKSLDFPHKLIVREDSMYHAFLGMLK